MSEADFRFQRTWGPKPAYPKVRFHQPIDKRFIVIAGPCSVEDSAQIEHIAELVARSGATHLRGGVFRAGTYPGKSFGWIDEKLIADFAGAARRRGLKTIIEVLDYRPESIDMIYPYADCFQVGCRQMQNYALLRRLGATEKQIFLKRHPGATLDEWLGAAEHLLYGGRCELALVERGSVSHVDHCRWDLSISMIPAAKAITDIPVIVDASHGTGRRDLVEPMTLAGVAAGADGLLVEVHPEPDKSLSDPEQAIAPEAFIQLMTKVTKLRSVL
jgi:3-deoxy-7-phosphoheptulonate synthase